MSYKFLDLSGLSRFLNKVKDLIPTKTSELTNDSGFITQADTVDSTLSSTSEKAVQNKVIKQALDSKANDNSVVHTTGNESVSGTKSFNSDLNLNYASTDVDDIIDSIPGLGTADDYVHISGNETVNGVKSFPNGIIANVSGTATPLAHTHTTSDITNLSIPSKVSDLTNDSGFITGVSWNDVSGKPSSFTPSSHSHGSITNDGKLGTASKVLITDSNKKITTSSVSDTELGYLSGVTSAIQTQISGKANASHTHSASDITSGLATVATSGSYNDLSNKPTIPTVNNATLTIQKNGSTVKTFTANASSNVTANITVPTKVSELTNDSGYLTSHQDISGLSAKADTIKSLSISGRTITYTKGDDTTGTLTTQDNNTWTAMVGATSSANGSVGYVNAVPPKDGYNTKYLRADGTWAVPPDHTYTVNNKTLTIQKNGTSVATFTANSASDVTANIVVPTKTSDLTNDSHGTITMGTDSTSTASPAHGGTFTCIDSVTKDSNGHVTAVNVKTVTLPSDNNTDTLVTQNVSTANENHPILLTVTKDATANQGAKTSIFASGVKVNPSTNTVTATTFSGALSGNASSATQFSANKSVTLTGDVTGTASSKAGWSVATTLSDSGVTAGTYGPSADVTGNNNSTISVPEITVDSKGRVTSVANRTLTCKNNTYNVYNKTLTIQKNGTSVATFTSNSNTDVTANITVPTKVSELTNDSGFLTAHQSLSNYSTLANTVKSLSISGKTITVTPGSGSAYTLTTQDTVYTHPTTSGNKHIPSGGSSGQFLGWDSDGTAKWVNNPNSDTLMTQNVSTTNATYPLLLCPTANATANQGAKTGIFAKSVKVNPSTNALSATQLWSNSQTIQNSGFTKGTNPSAQSYWSMYMADKNGNDWAANCLGVFETTCDTSGNVTSVMKAVKNEANSSSAGAIAVTYNKSANTVSTYAPTPATSSNDTNIATTAFVKAQGYITSSSNITGTSANVTGTVAIANGGTGATTRLNAVKALTNENVGTSSQFFLTITSNWGKAGYCSVADAKTVLSVPTKTSQLTNDSGFLTSHQSLSNYVTLNGTQTISGEKTFSSNLVYTNTLAKKHSSVTKGTNPSSTAWWTIGMCDKNGLSAADNTLGMFETSLATDGIVSTYLRAYKNTAGSSACSEVRAKYNTTNDIGWINCTGEDICLISNKKTQGTVPTANQDCTFKMFDNSSHTMFEIRNRSVANSSSKQTYTTISVAPNTSGAGVTDAFRIYAQTENSSTVCNVLTQNFLPISNNTYALGDSSHKWKTAHAVNFYENGTALSSKYMQRLTNGAIPIGMAVICRFVFSSIAKTVSGVKKLTSGDIVDGNGLYFAVFKDTRYSGTFFAPVIDTAMDQALGGTYIYKGRTISENELTSSESGILVGQFIRIT